jgi:hypothetical protein
MGIDLDFFTSETVLYGTPPLSCHERVLVFPEHDTTYVNQLYSNFLDSLGNDSPLAYSLSHNVFDVIPDDRLAGREVDYRSALFLSTPMRCFTDLGDLTSDETECHAYRNRQLDAFVAYLVRQDVIVAESLPVGYSGTQKAVLAELDR